MDRVTVSGAINHQHRDPVGTRLILPLQQGHPGEVICFHGIQRDVLTTKRQAFERKGTHAFRGIGRGNHPPGHGEDCQETEGDPEGDFGGSTTCAAHVIAPSFGAVR